MAVALAACAPGAAPTPIVILVTPNPTVAPATPSETPNYFGPGLAADLREFSFAWTALVCVDLYRPGSDPPPAASVQRALDASKVIAPSMQSIRNREAPKGWLAIKNDAVAVTERVMPALTAVGFCLSTFESQPASDLYACYEDEVEAACGTQFTEGVDRVLEAIDSMP